MLSIIVPLQEGENKIYALLEQFEEFNVPDIEIILAFPESAPSNVQDIIREFPKLDLKIFRFGNSRASQLNLGAQAASAEYLWFLHADSSIEAKAAQTVKSSLKTNENKVFYFKLKFENSKCKFMILNSIGANLRSVFFKAPFGDQGFSMSRTVFNRVGGFPVDAKYGEDNLFILNAKKLKTPIEQLNSIITTSARKYEENGWLKITLLHQYLWAKQNILNRLSDAK